MKTFGTLLTSALLLFTSCIVRTSDDNSAKYSTKDYSFAMKFNARSPVSLDVSTVGGNISVTGSNNDTIEVLFVVRKRGRVVDMTLDELKKIAEVSIDNTTPSELKIKVSRISWRNTSVGFIIKTPYETSSLVNTSGGNLMAENLIGKQNFHTSGGNMDYHNLSGAVEANTSGGNINITNSKAEFDISTSGGNISLDDINGKVNASTSGGNIDANGLQPELKAHTSGGNIHVSDIKGNTEVGTSGGFISLNHLSGSVLAKTSGGSINATISELKGSLMLETNGGNIDATIPSGLGLDLDISAERIETKLVNFTGSSTRKEIKGKTNNGGIPVTLYTSGGSITLNYK